MAERQSPYDDRPAAAFWRTAVADADPAAPKELFAPKWGIAPSDRIATAGSCFAQHIGRHLARRGSVLDVEPAPRGLPVAERARFGYGLYSARYGNIYTTRQLRQLAEEVEGLRTPADPVWRKGARWFDALRPGVEPSGLESAATVALHRAYHLAAVRRLFETMDVFVFTLGLTEAFADRSDGTVYPSAPGVIAGRFDPERHVFLNARHADVVADVEAFRDSVGRMRGGRPWRTLLTVSPVPLTATASGGHVLAATTYSKATLRAAAGDLAADDPTVDYFPSYEIVTNPAARSAFYEPSLRAVTRAGVEAVMAVFLAAYGFDADGTPAPPGEESRHGPAADADGEAADDLVCEDALNAAFGT